MAEIVSIEKTFVLGTNGVDYFEVTTTTFDNEEHDVHKRLIGPAAVLANYYADDFVSRSRALANNAMECALSKKQIAEMNATDTAIGSISGVSPKRAVLDRFKAELLKPGWQINLGSGFVSLVFTVTPQNVLRYSINGAATQVAEVWGAMLRFNNFPSANTITEFYATDNHKHFFNLPDGSVRIKRP